MTPTFVYFCVNDTGDSSQVERVLVRVLDASGTLRTLVDQDQPPTGSGCSLWYGGYRYAEWNGLDHNGQQVADGAYTFGVQATDTTNLTGSSTSSPVAVDRRIPAR